jgi:hypothetical protein
VILDPDAAAGDRAPSRSLARRLQRAGYATFTVTRDPSPPLPRSNAGRRCGATTSRSSDTGAARRPSSRRSSSATTSPSRDAPAFRSAVAFGPTCARRTEIGSAGRSPRFGGPGSTGAPHRGDVARQGLYRTATPLLIVGGQTQCRDLARDSYAHEYFVRYTTDDAFAALQSFIAQNAQYANVCSFPPRSRERR